LSFVGIFYIWPLVDGVLEVVVMDVLEEFIKVCLICGRWIFRKLEGVVGTGWSWLRIGTVGGHLWVR
jgi:hypothetical protein